MTMTIHWKHFLMVHVQLVFRFNYLGESNAFSELFYPTRLLQTVAVAKVQRIWGHVTVACNRLSPKVSGHLLYDRGNYAAMRADMGSVNWQHVINREKY
jgi:hypothetical protein